MSYKVLEQNGVLNENIDGAAFNNFCAKNVDGIIGGVLEECPMYLSSSNIISIGSGLLIIKGFRVKILEDGLHFSIPSGTTPGVTQIICSLTLNKDRSVLTEIFLSEERVLKQDSILTEEEGKYEVEIGRFYWDGSSAKNLTRSISVIPVNQQAGGSIELAQTLEGNEENKAPSVKAVSDEIGGFFDLNWNTGSAVSWRGLCGLIPSDNYAYTDYFEVESGQKIRIKTAIASADAGIAFYKTDGTSVSGVQPINSGNDEIYIITVPENATKCRYSCLVSKYADSTARKYDVYDTIKKAAAKAGNVITTKYALSNETWINGKAFSSNKGMIISDSPTILCEKYFKVESYAQDEAIPLASGSTSGNTMSACVCFYDENKNFISRSGWNSSAITVVSGAVYFRMCARLYDADNNAIGGNYADYDLENRYLGIDYKTAELLGVLQNEINENSEKLKASEYLDYDTQFTHQDVADLASLTISATYNNYYSRRPFNIVHCTDLHSRSTDIKCFQNAIKLLSRDELDCMILSGDLVASHFTSDNTALETEWAKITKDVIFTVGNHDVGNSLLVAESGTDTQVYSRYYVPHLLANFMYDANTTLAEYNTANPSSNPMMNYYADYSAYKVRIISMYQYNSNMEVDSTDSTKLKYFRGTVTYKQSDVDWLINTLNNTPENYTVLFVTHEPENFGSKTNDWQSINIANSKVWTGEKVLTKILTAYKQKKAISETYWQNAEIVTTLNIIADFTGANGDFGAWLCGHTHDDFVGKTANGELNLICKTCDNLLAQTDSSILKTEGTPNENAINVISVDTEHKTITVKRIGAKFSRNGDWRNVVSLTY